MIIVIIITFLSVKYIKPLQIEHKLVVIEDYESAFDAISVKDQIPCVTAPLSVD